MIERAGRPRFEFKATQTICVVGEVGGQNFDGDFAVKPCVFGTVNFAHPARAELRQDFVVIKLSARRNCHLGASKLLGNARSLTSAPKHSYDDTVDWAANVVYGFTVIVVEISRLPAVTVI